MFRRQILTALLVVAISASSLAGLAFVADVGASQSATVGGNALRVSPVRYDLRLSPGVKQDIELTIENISNVPGKLKVSINDFMASSDESGRPNIILNDDEYAPSHSLKRMVLPVAPFSIGARETKIIKVSVSVPNDAAGGGYYAAVRFSPADTQTEQALSLSASVGTLVLLTVNGDIKENLTVDSFDVRKGGTQGTFFMNHKGLEAVVRFKNGGNVQVEPFGNIILKRFGKVVAEYEINDASTVRGSVLPDSVRKFTESLDKVQPFGKYTLEGNFGYGSSGQLLVAKTTFYVIPLFMILIGVGVVLLVLFLIFVLPRMVRAYNRRVIRRANRRRY